MYVHIKTSHKHSIEQWKVRCLRIYRVKYHFTVHLLKLPYMLLKVTESESQPVMFDSLWPHGRYSPWNSPGQNTGVGSCSLFQGIFATQWLNPVLLHWRQILYQLSHQRSPLYVLNECKFISVKIWKVRRKDAC